MLRIPIRSKIRNVLTAISDSARIATWMASHSSFLLVLNWHQVSPVFDPLLHQRYTWTSLATFMRSVSYLAAHFQIISLPEAMRRLKDDSIQGRYVALTFDDGDASIANHVVPFLRSVNLPATFFINTAYLGRQDSYWFPILSYFCMADQAHSRQMSKELKENAHKLRTTDDPIYYDEVRRSVENLASSIPHLKSRLVSSEWLFSLDGDQFTIGLHGHEHQRFSMMSPNWQREDLRQNIQILSQFRSYAPIFALPFGRPWDWTPETIAIADEYGIDILMADGGVNLKPTDYILRQPADGQSARKLVGQAIVGSIRSPKWS